MSPLFSGLSILQQLEVRFKLSVKYVSKLVSQLETLCHTQASFRGRKSSTQITQVSNCVTFYFEVLHTGLTKGVGGLKVRHPMEVINE